MQETEPEYTSPPQDIRTTCGNPNIHSSHDRISASATSHEINQRILNDNSNSASGSGPNGPIIPSGQQDQAQESEEEDEEGNKVSSIGAQGEFKGRPNLYAFMQAKQWNSVVALDPVKTYGINTLVEIEPKEGCWTEYTKIIMS